MQECEAKFEALQQRPTPFHAVLLLSARALRAQGAQWGPSGAQVDLWWDGVWTSLKSLEGRKQQRRKKLRKKPLRDVLGALKWYERPHGQGPPVALVGHFLREMGLLGHNANERAVLWNRTCSEKLGAVPFFFFF